MAPDADRLLPDVEVQEAADLALGVAARALLLDAADEEHLAVELGEVLELTAGTRLRGDCVCGSGVRGDVFSAGIGGGGV